MPFLQVVNLSGKTKILMLLLKYLNAEVYLIFQYICDNLNELLGKLTKYICFILDFKFA